MRPEERDLAYLRDMLRCARDVKRHTAGIDEETYAENELLELAIERLVEIIGEAASRVSDLFRAAHPEIPWRDIIGQRIVLAHRYGEILPARMWHTATVAVPALIAALEPLLPADPEEP